MKHVKTDANYAILTKWVKLQHEKKPVTNLLIIQSVGVEQTFMKFIEILVPQNNLFTGKKTVVETISVAIADISDVQCFGLYIIAKYIYEIY